MDKNKDLNDRGLSDQIKGTAKEVGGKIRGDVGDALDNSSEHLKGRAQQAEGNVQKNAGKAERKIGDSLDEGGEYQDDKPNKF